MQVRPIELLLVDDDELDVMNVQRALAAAAGDDVSEIIVAGDGLEALAILRSGAVHPERVVVVLDLRMPRMSGLELLRAIRADAALHMIPAVVLTTSDDPSDLREAYALHCGGYFVKPSSQADYRALVGTLRQYWATSARPAP